MSELRFMWFILKQTIKETFCKHVFTTYELDFKTNEPEYFCKKCGIAKKRYEAERIFK